MRRLVAALIVLAALAAAGSASAGGLRVGVADDWPKFHACGDVWWQSAADVGLQDLRITVQWNGPGTAIPYPANIQQAVDCALISGMRPILSIYPAKPSLIGPNRPAQARFAGFVAQVALAYPGVDNFIVGNEPNVNRFWQPQYIGGKDAAGRDYEHTLAQSYDALKRVRPDGIVWGPAISSRGNDNATTQSNPSHSPVWFIKDMGDAYRASGRQTPIFDEFNMHPYPPVQDKDPFTQPFAWPQAGAANLDRVKQALWDAFAGTAQPIPAEQAGGRTAQSARFAGQGLPMNLDEAGEQTTVTAHQHAYTDPPESIIPISETQQSQAYRNLIEIAACDPDVKSVLFFPLIDEPDLNHGFQSGMLYADLSHKQSYEGVKSKIADSQGRCQGGIAGISQAWTHTTSVVGAQASFSGTGTSAFGFGFSTAENVTYKAGLFPVAGPSGAPAADLGRALASTRRSHQVGQTPVLAAAGHAKAYYKPKVKLGGKPVAPGYYVYAIKLAAAVNPARSTTLVSSAFLVGKDGTPPKNIGQGNGNGQGNGHGNGGGNANGKGGGNGGGTGNGKGGGHSDQGSHKPKK